MRYTLRVVRTVLGIFGFLVGESVDTEPKPSDIGRILCDSPSFRCAYVLERLQYDNYYDPQRTKLHFA